MQDKDGREYAKLSRLVIGDKVEVDDDFDCMKGTRIVHGNKQGKYITCDEGSHQLDGQLMDDGDSLVGIYKL